MFRTLAGLHHWLHTHKDEIRSLSVFSGHWFPDGSTLIAANPGWQTSSIQEIVGDTGLGNLFASHEQPVIGIAGYRSANQFNWPSSLYGSYNSQAFFCAGHYQDTARFDVSGNLLALHTQSATFRRFISLLTHLDQQPVTPDTATGFSCAPFTPSWDYSDYETAFRCIQRYIIEGDCYQVNLAQRFIGRFEGSSLAAFAQLIDSISPPYAAFVSTAEGDVISCSPEHFLTIHDREIITEPIKGTRARHQDPGQDAQLKKELSDSNKDRAENLMIVDLLRNDLGKIAEPGSVRVTDLFRVESFQNVHHLVSTIKATLKPDIHPLIAHLRCMPGGSITGAPKHRAMQIIKELETGDRGPYCGSAFYYDGITLTSNILIRTLLIRNGQAELWGGGGIVADSDCVSEYNETLIKINHIIKALGSPPLPFR